MTPIERFESGDGKRAAVSTDDLNKLEARMARAEQLLSQWHLNEIDGQPAISVVHLFLYGEES